MAGHVQNIRRVVSLRPLFSRSEALGCCPLLMLSPAGCLLRGVSYLTQFAETARLHYALFEHKVCLTF